LQVVRLVLQRVEALAALRDLVDVVAHDADCAVDLLPAVSTNSGLGSSGRLRIPSSALSSPDGPARERHDGKGETYSLKRGGPRIAGGGGGASRRGSAAVGGDIGVIGLVVGGHFAGWRERELRRGNERVFGLAGGWERGWVGSGRTGGGGCDRWRSGTSGG
jgi:hypothetical protein